MQLWMWTEQFLATNPASPYFACMCDYTRNSARGVQSVARVAYGDRNR